MISNYIQIHALVHKHFHILNREKNSFKIKFTMMKTKEKGDTTATDATDWVRASPAPFMWSTIPLMNIFQCWQENIFCNLDKCSFN